jgi:hypothetical protein
MAGQPWFRTSLFSSMPVTWQGWVLTLGLAFVVIVLASVMIVVRQ